MTTPEELFTKSEFDKKREHLEFNETVRTSDWLKGQIRQGRTITHVQCPFPGLLFAHYPAEGAHGKEGFFAQMMGVMPYWHDFLFYWGPPANAGFIELKISGKGQSTGQRDHDSRLAAMGFKYRAVCYTTEEVRDYLIKWGNPYTPVPIPPRKPTKADKMAFQAAMYMP